MRSSSTSNPCLSMPDAEVNVWLLHVRHLKSAVTLAVHVQQGSQLSEESGSEEDAPPIKRWLEAQEAGADDTDGDKAGVAALASHSTAEALHHSSAAASGTLVGIEVLQRLCAPACTCSITPSPDADPLAAKQADSVPVVMCLVGIHA